MHSQGLLQRWQVKHWPPIHSCTPGGATVLTLYHTQGIFYVLAASIMLAGIVLLLELLLRKTNLDVKIVEIYETIFVFANMTYHIKDHIV